LHPESQDLKVEEMVVQINLEFAAKDANSAVKRGDLIIVIDVLRCSTSIINALANGAKSVVPTITLREAYALHSQDPDFLLAGERKGCRPKGFDLGNSPSEFISQRVCGKNLIMTTTSGTMALVKSREAKWVLVGAFLNAASVARKAAQIAEDEETNVSLVLSGERGQFSLEDFICAGAIAESLSTSNVHCCDEALAALLAFKQAKNSLCENIMTAQHARHLAKLGFKKDVEFSCQLDILSTIPIYRDGKITKLG
jgi:2-phosphosulfolactate phosphatase